MNVASTRFGIMSVPAEKVLTFPSGVLGFPEWTRYVMLDHNTDAPFKWLHCVEEASLAFVVVDPSTDELSLVVILTIPSDDPSAVTANLRGPLLMNPRTRLCKQLVLAEDYPTRYPVFSPSTHAESGLISAHAEAVPA
jgi:flagellar assembly factor FliW